MKHAVCCLAFTFAFVSAVPAQQNSSPDSNTSQHATAKRLRTEIDHLQEESRALIAHNLAAVITQHADPAILVKF